MEKDDFIERHHLFLNLLRNALRLFFLLLFYNYDCFIISLLL
jgi:hypothetical protein